jgi:hypothetical protein
MSIPYSVSPNGKAMEEVERTDPLFQIYAQELSTHTTASIMHSAEVKNNLAGRIGRRFTLADPILTVEDQFSMFATTTPSINWTRNSHPGTTQTTQHDDHDVIDL